MDIYERIAERAEAIKYGWPRAVEERLVGSGKLHARERIGLLVRKKKKNKKENRGKGDKEERKSGVKEK
jgi:hypothetical protein